MERVNEKEHKKRGTALESARFFQTVLFTARCVRTCYLAFTQSQVARIREERSFRNSDNLHAAYYVITRSFGVRVVYKLDGSLPRPSRHTVTSC